MYTSGTTGEPKGVILTNGAFMSEVLSMHQLLVETDKPVWFQIKFAHVNILQRHELQGCNWNFSLLQGSEDDTYFSFLPLAHIFDQIIETYCIYSGASIGFWQGVR